jgi:hypothetical protein
MKVVKLILFFLVIFSLGACKVNYSLNGASISPDTKTITISNFPNNSALAPNTISINFTEALKNKISSQTRLISVPRNGHVKLEGSITGYSVSPVAVQASNGVQNIAALNRLTISVSVIYTNTKDEKLSYNQTFTQFADFEASKSLNSEQDRLIKIITENIVNDIFIKCFVNF